jgi:hypothetical protein
LPQADRFGTIDRVCPEDDLAMQCTVGSRFLHGGAAIAVALLAAFAAPAAALMTGITGFSGQQTKTPGTPLYCSNAGMGCHFTDPGTKAPMVRFEGPTQVDPGAQATYTFIVTSENPTVQIQAGLDVAASGGTLGALLGQQEQALKNFSTMDLEITHTGPKDNDQNGEAAWQFTWQAPTTPGVYVLFGAGNSVDGSTTQEGDEAAITTLMITVGDVAPTPSPTPTPAPTATPGSACAGDCNGDGQVTVNELILGVNIALGSQPASVCTAIDINGDGTVTINELIAAVTRALNGC